MRKTVKFKLKLNKRQEKRLFSWRRMVRAISNYCLNDRISSYAQSFISGSYCDLRSKAEAVPLTCSVNRSASIGCPWKQERIAHAGKNKGKLVPASKRSAYEMHCNYLTEMKSNRPWYRDVQSQCLQQALRHQDVAFERFFSGVSGFPGFKKTVDVKGFEFPASAVKYDESRSRVTIPKIGTVGYFKSQSLSLDHVVKTSWVKFEADGFYIVSLLDYPEVPDYLPKHRSELKTVVGIDRGVKKITASSDGTIIPNPGILKKNERRLRIRQSRLSRKKKGSNNRAKAGKAVARVHQKIKRQREDFQWKTAKQIATSADVIGFEKLNIKGMIKRCKPKKDPQTGKYLKNGQSRKKALNKAITDASWYSLEQKVKHQALKLGSWIENVPAYNTSLECSECGYTHKENRPSQEKFICGSCGHHEDADVGAGIVIAKRTKEKLSIDTLRVVSPKVTPKPEVTGSSNRRKLTAGLPVVSGNWDSKRLIEQAVFVQLSLNLFPECGSSPQESPGIARSV